MQLSQAMIDLLTLMAGLNSGGNVTIFLWQLIDISGWNRETELATSQTLEKDWNKNLLATLREEQASARIKWSWEHKSCVG